MPRCARNDEIMNPITKYLKNLFAAKRIIGDDSQLQGLTKANYLLQSLIEENKVPGLAITVVKQGEAIFQKGYGYADMEKKILVNPEKTIFRIASVSKPIAASALAHMIADGLIDLDASFYTYVPYYPKKKYDFTIRQLASHTAGIRGYQGIEYGLNKPYSIKESIEIFATDDLLFEPGTDYLYNSFDWVLISLAMQEVSGIPFEKYVQEKVLNPLEMSNTFAPTTVSLSGFENHLEHENTVSTEPVSSEVEGLNLTERITTFYSKNRLGFRTAIPVNNFYKLAGGGYLSTTSDIAKFGQAYLRDKVLNKEILSQFLISESIKGNKIYYGLGWQVSEDKMGRPFYGHVGNGVGGYSNFFVYPNEQMVFSILVNCTNPGIQQKLDEVITILIGQFNNNDQS